MSKLDYTALRPDGHTISQLRAYILVELKTISDLKGKIADSRQSLADHISHLSQQERDQLVLDQPFLFPNGLPTTEIIPYIENKRTP